MLQIGGNLLTSPFGRGGCGEAADGEGSIRRAPRDTFLLPFYHLLSIICLLYCRVSRDRVQRTRGVSEMPQPLKNNHHFEKPENP